MTYEEVVHYVRDAYENADAREIYEHIAVQVNVTGEGAGALYIEVAGRAVCVEPYDYYDRDGLLTASSATIVDIAKGVLTFREAIDQGLLKVEGNMDKLTKLAKIKPEVAHKKRAAKAEPKAETKAAAKADVKAEAKPAAKAEAKVEAKAEEKAEAKPVAKADAKPVAKPVVKADAKPVAKP